MNFFFDFDIFQNWKKSLLDIVLLFYCAIVSWDIAHVDLFFYFDFLIVPSNAIYGVSRDRGTAPVPGDPCPIFSDNVQNWSGNPMVPLPGAHYTRKRL